MSAIVDRKLLAMSHKDNRNGSLSMKSTKEVDELSLDTHESVFVLHSGPKKY